MKTGPSDSRHRKRWGDGALPLRATFAWLVVAALAVLLGCSGRERAAMPATGAASDSAAWAADDSLARIAVTCSVGVIHDRPIPINGRTSPDTCVHVPGSSHLCFGDTAVWTSHVDFPVTVTLGPCSPFPVDSFTVAARGTVRLKVVAHNRTCSYGTIPDRCKGLKQAPPEVIVDD